ncbi:MAG: plastocyanin/azurin family copper-binding protein [Vicinamibacterales bacterium]
MKTLSVFFRRSSAISRAAFLVAVAGGIGLFALIPLIAANPRPAPREVVLVVRDMTFYLPGSDVPNPTLRLKPGEELRVVVRNEEPGMTHNFAVTSLQVAMEPIRGLGTGSVSFRAPDKPGRYDYRCTPHAQMMNGMLLVAE